MGDQVKVSRLPDCDICKEMGRHHEPAIFDGKTVMGPWAYMCGLHFTRWGVGLGTGQGQRLIVE